MFRQLKKNNDGVILVTVVIISLIMAMLAIGILSINTTQVKSGEQIKRDMIAELFARMVYWEIQANSINGFAIASQVTRSINNHDYVADISIGSTGTPPALNIVISY